MKILAYGECLIRWDVSPEKIIRQFPTGTPLNFLVNISKLTKMKPEIITALSNKEDSKEFINFFKTNDIDAKTYISTNLNMGSYTIYRKPTIHSWEVVYNRYNSAWQDYMNSNEELILDNYELGDHIHFDGISLQTNPNGFDKMMKIIKEAKENGMTTSFDFNFRWTLENKSLDNFKKIIKEIDHLGISPYDINNLQDKELDEEVDIKGFVKSYPNLKLVYGYKKESVNDDLNAKPYVWTVNEGLITGDKLIYQPIELIGQGDAYSAHIISSFIQGEKVNPTEALKWSIYKTNFIGDSTVPDFKDYINYKNKKNVIR